MKISITEDQLISAGLSAEFAHETLARAAALIENTITPEQAWQQLSKKLLSSAHAFPVHQLFFSSFFPEWESYPETAPVIIPAAESIESANLSVMMKKSGINDLASFHRYTVNHAEDFLQSMVKQLNIVFDQAPQKMLDDSKGIESPIWFKGAALNIVNSCFTANPEATAIIYEDADKNLCTLSYEALNLLSNRIANSLVEHGFKKADAIGIAMPMHYMAIAIYLGIIKMGGVVVSIADSFSSEEMAIRLKNANAKAIFTQDFIDWGNKKIPLYEKVKNNSHPVSIIVLESEWLHKMSPSLRGCFSGRSNPSGVSSISFVDGLLRPEKQPRNDGLPFNDFLVNNNQFTAVSCDPMAACNILFSSGTTGIPKAIPWNHSTAIKVASDAFFHQNIIPGDILAWPTNLGWMMGPWLIFAALMNHATIAAYTGSPKEREFGEFIQRAKVNMLGVVPTLVAAWRKNHCMEQLDWSAIKVFSSTGECSNRDDMFYLMSLANYKPVIEYCGGTEIGGAYVSSTVIENNYPSLFTTAAMGSDFTIIDETGNQTANGEVAIIPPSIGLSTTLLNTDHHETYFANMPRLANGKMLRRHGDQMQKLPGGHYSILGRIDDTMNLGGIKISAAEIERTLTGLTDIIEVAAIAIPPPDNGPALLVIFAATDKNPDKKIILKEMQTRINIHLNPLFKIHEVIFRKDLPKTASNKIMRRVLRKSLSRSDS